MCFQNFKKLKNAFSKEAITKNWLNFKAQSYKEWLTMVDEIQETEKLTLFSV